MTYVLLIVGIWFGVHWAYVLVTSARRINERERLTLYWLVIIYPAALVGLLLDCIFNLVLGSIMFAELPEELLFTERCKRHVANSRSDRINRYRQRLARWWQRQLNIIDPGHV